MAGEHDVEKKYSTKDWGTTKWEDAWTASITNGAFHNYSITAAFGPLRTLSPVETDPATIAQALCTLIADMNRIK